MGAPPLRELLRGRGVEDVCRAIDPDDPELEGLLYLGRRATVADAHAARHEAHALKLDARAYEAWRAAQRRPVNHMISMSPLSSEWPAPFVLDGLACCSVSCFHQCLKLEEDSPARAAVAADTAERRRFGTGGRRTFRWRGEEIAVNSVEHGVLIARATEAKLKANPPVREALLATGMSLLYMGPPNALVLGRYMPLALMVLRFRIGARRS
ncbi:hypothetical protein [Nannocystis bainbridge]|uniref:Uncharacterized protein n=1 Tax=Nannocystis bainbridge TaxID=2995303 RepID=A0ABT5EC15_9BACT|nr:hypothetical protein [Nannocystis bainbridge]MDC0722448.1 hypothetical protein [Nannocystis bainbridge]